MKPHVKIIFLLFLLLLLPSIYFTNAQDSTAALFSNDTIVTPKIDGNMIEAEWNDSYKNVIGLNGLNSINSCEVYIKNDNEYLYIAFKVIDPKHSNLIILSFADNYGNLVSKHMRWDLGSWELYWDGSQWVYNQLTSVVSEWAYYDPIQIVEWKIPLKSGNLHDLVINPGDSIRLGIRYGLGDASSYPIGYKYMNSNTWASLKLVEASIIKNGGFEGLVIGAPYTITGWEEGGMLGVASSDDPRFGKSSLYLCQWSHGSDVWQNFIVDDKDATLLFLYKPYPIGHEVTFQVKLDGKIIFNKKFIGDNSEYQWTQIGIPLKPIFEQYNLAIGLHELRFYIPPGTQYAENSYSSHIGIDNVTIVKNFSGNLPTFPRVIIDEFT
jgi:hypothetical protein